MTPVADPMVTGFAASIARPGDTGMSMVGPASAWVCANHADLNDRLLGWTVTERKTSAARRQQRIKLW